MSAADGLFAACVCVGGCMNDCVCVGVHLEVIYVNNKV